MVHSGGATTAPRIPALSIAAVTNPPDFASSTSTQAIQALCSAEVPVCYFSMGGWFYGITTGLNTKNVFLRRNQLTSCLTIFRLHQR